MVDHIIGPGINISSSGSFRPGVAPAGRKDFMAELSDVFAKHTGNLVGTSVGELGPIYTTKPENLQTLMNIKGSIV